MLTQPHAKVETLRWNASDIREAKHRLAEATAIETVPSLDLARHRVEVVDDGSRDVTFRWHFPRGTFDKHMSALELTTFILPHMAAIVPFLNPYPQAQQEWKLMLSRLTTTVPAILDDLVPWMRIQQAVEEDSVLELSLSVPLPQAPMGTSFVISR